MVTTLPRARLRQIAEIAMVDWRSVRATLEGRRVARRAGERVRVALRALDIPIPPPQPNTCPCTVGQPAIPGTIAVFEHSASTTEATHAPQK